MVNMTDYLITQEAITKENGSIKFLPTAEPEAIPETIRGLIERQIAALPKQDQELLEVAAVAGTTFSVAVMARVLGRAREAMETEYHELAERTHYLQYAGLRIRPKGRGSPRYSFVHALYQNTIYDRIDEARRRRLHQIIGERTEAAYAETTETVAAELAAHFERSGDLDRAIQYYLEAAHRTMQQSGYQEAIAYARSGLELIRSLTRTPQRADRQLELQLYLSLSLTAMSGYARVEVADAFRKTTELCQRGGKESALIQALSGLWVFHLMRAELQTAL
jgi:predicted ATPase